MADERRNLQERAQLAEMSARWKDMAMYMRQLVEQDQDLSVIERNLLANAYKNYVGEKRAAWRVIVSIEQQTDVLGRKKDLSKEYKQKIEDEVRETCAELLELIGKYLIKTIDIENQIFYMKMQGDYNRYMAEIAADSSPGDSESLDNARMAYTTGYELAKEHLSPGHPLRLGLVLNFSVLHHEILESYDVARELVKTTLEAGEDDLNNQSDESRNDSALILHLLKDNLRIWTEESDKSSWGHTRSTSIY